MKSFYLLLFLSIGGFTNAQIVNIPDANFKNALLNELVADFDGDGWPESNADTNNDNEIQVSEAEAVLGLSVFSRAIASLEGLQSFTNLEFLFCELNVLSNLDLSGCSNLRFLYCHGNVIEELNLSQNPALEVIMCDLNQLSNLDLSANLNLEVISAAINNIDNVILPQTATLEEINFRDNLLQEIDVSQIPNLIELNCGGNLLLNIDVSQNPNLEFFAAGGNLFTDIDVTNNPNLTSLYCNGNQLTTLDVSQNLELISLSCHRNRLTNLYIADNINLISLTCFENELVTLDLSSNINLTGLDCNSNILRNLNIKNGNNLNMIRMFAFDNPELTCIMVDDEDAIYPECFQFSGWCKDATASYSEFCELGAEEVTLIDFQLFPNPAGNILNIQSKENIETVKIYSTQGIFIKEVSSNSIDVSQLSAGMYFAEITIGGKSFTKKFIKE